MPNISRIIKITPGEAARLRQKGIQTVEDLWALIGKEFDPGVHELAERTGLARERLIELLGARHESVDKEAVDISQLQDITPEEIARLRHKKIQTIDDLWARVGKDFRQGITLVATATNLKENRLIDLLVAQGLREAKQGDNPWLQRHASLFVGMIALVVVGLCSWIALALLLPPLGLRSSVIVAARDLKANQVVRVDDLAGAPLVPRDTYFKNAQELEGLILAQEVPRNKPLRFEDVLRLQVVAATDIPSDTLIASTAISMTWSPYQPGAALRIEQVVGHKARHAFRKGEVILSEFIEVKPATTLQAKPN